VANGIAEAGSRCFRVKYKILLEKQRFSFDDNLCSVISGLVSVKGRKMYWKSQKSCCGTRVDVAQWLMCLDCKDAGQELQLLLNVSLLVHVGCIMKDLGLQAPQKKNSLIFLC